MAKSAQHIESWTDEELVQTYREQGDPQCLGELFRRYTDMVFLVCMKYLKDPQESEDMTMQLFEKLVEDLRKYEIQRFRFWLHKVTKHQCLAHLDKQKRRRVKREQFHLDQADIVENGQEQTLFGELDEKEQLLQHLEAALAQLQDHQRTCVELFYLKKKSYQEVADLTGYTLKEVKSYLQNGKRNLKNHLQSLAEEEIPGS